MSEKTKDRLKQRIDRRLKEDALEFGIETPAEPDLKDLDDLKFMTQINGKDKEVVLVDDLKQEARKWFDFISSDDYDTYGEIYYMNHWLLDFFGIDI